MRKLILGMVSGVLVGFFSGPLAAHELDLPAGPIRDRHELMEGIGKQAKVIGDALKTDKLEPVGPAAEKIHDAAGKALPLFPKGSTHPNSRAKAEIWEKWADFEAGMKKMETDSGALATVAKNSGDVRGAAQTMFGDCKTCHDNFRVPEKK